MSFKAELNIILPRYVCCPTLLFVNFVKNVSFFLYSTKSELDLLAKEIKNYEPNNALTDHHNGLTFYIRFSNILSNILNKNGTALLEFGGEKQRDAINKIFSKYKLSFHKDLNNESRVVEVSYV